MSDGNTPKDINLEELTALKEKCQSLQADNEKLSKIFEERQTKTYNAKDAIKKDELLKILGIEKDPQKSELELVKENFTNLSSQLEKVKSELTKKDEALALSAKKQSVEQLAKAYNFIDTSDVINAIDYNNENLEEQIKILAQTKKHWVARQILGNSFANTIGKDAETLQTKWREAMQKGDIETAIAIKRKMTN